MTVFAFVNERDINRIRVVIDRVWFGGSANTIHNADKYVLADNHKFVFFNIGLGFDETQKVVLRGATEEFITKPQEHGVTLRDGQDIFVLSVDRKTVFSLTYESESKSVFWDDLRTDFFTTGIYSDTIKYLYHFDDHSILEAVAKVDDLWNVDFGVDVFDVEGSGPLVHFLSDRDERPNSQPIRKC